MGHRQQSKQDIREQRILDATAHLIVRYGYDKTSVSDIAEEAGISKGAVYLHFDSKDALMHKLILREMLHFIEQWVVCVEEDTSDKVFSSMYTHVLTLVKDNEFLWTLFSNRRWLLGKGLAHGNNSVFQQRLGLSLDMLNKLKTIEAIRDDVDPQATAYVFNMLNYGYLKFGEVVPDDMSPPTDKVIKEIGDLVQRHLEPDGDKHATEARKIIVGYLKGAEQIVHQMFDETNQ